MRHPHRPHDGWHELGCTLLIIAIAFVFFATVTVLVVILTTRIIVRTP